MSIAKTFVLSRTKTFRRGVRVFIKDKNGKYSARVLMFTKEHLVDKKDRSKPATKAKPAEYTTSDESILAALYSDSAYGKDFFEKGDEAGKKKTPGRVVSEEDAGMVALENLFRAANLPFDSSKPVNVLKHEYNVHVAALSGIGSQVSPPREIPHTPVDVQADLIRQKAEARQKYVDKYGENVPEVVYNDSAFLDGLSNPDFDARAYIESKLAKEAKIEPGSPEHESLLAQYRDAFGNNAPNQYKNNIGWLLKRLS